MQPPEPARLEAAAIVAVRVLQDVIVDLDGRGLKAQADELAAAQRELVQAIDEQRGKCGG